MPQPFIFLAMSKKAKTENAPILDDKTITTEIIELVVSNFGHVPTKRILEFYELLKNDKK